MSLLDPYNMGQRMMHSAIGAGFEPTYWEITDEQWLEIRAHHNSTYVSDMLASKKFCSLPVFIRRGESPLIPMMALFSGSAALRKRLDDLAEKCASLGRDTIDAPVSSYRELASQRNALQQEAVEISRRLPPAIGMIVMPPEKIV